ncbi:PQQ-like beta-propeller repeat protein, partial [bacterium]|nr:PQQ-like beta-propeller repeat protein [bacterium]
NVKWKVSIEGKGSGSPVVWGDRVFVVTAVSSEAPSRESDESSGRRGRRIAPLTQTDFQILCFDRATGKKIWQQTLKKPTTINTTENVYENSSAIPYSHDACAK